MFSRRHMLKSASVAVGLMAFSPAAFAQGAGAAPAADQNFIWGRKLRKIADNRVIHRFFDTTPISPSGRYMGLIRFGVEDRSVRPGDVGDILVVDLKTGRERVVAKTKGFELQLGAQVQWGRSDKELFFSDVDTSTWKARTILLNPRSGKRRVLDGPLFMVSPDGKRICGYDMITSRYAQIGYGVIVPKENAPRVTGPRPDNGVYITDVASGKSRLIATSAAIFAVLSKEVPIEKPETLEFYVFQVKWNPQGTRLMISYQWAPIGGERRRAVLTMLPDGSDIRVALRPEQWARGGHHICWMADGEHISMNLNVDDESGIELVSFKYDGSDLKTIYDPGSGHPSQHPKGLPLIVTDAYPGEPVTTKPGSVPIRFINLRTQSEVNVAEVYVSTQGGEFRIDPHPAWDPTGRFVVFNGYVGGTRNVWMVDVGDLVDAEMAASTRGKTEKM